MTYINRFIMLSTAAFQLVCRRKYNSWIRRWQRPVELRWMTPIRQRRRLDGARHKNRGLRRATIRTCTEQPSEWELYKDLRKSRQKQHCTRPRWSSIMQSTGGQVTFIIRRPCIDRKDSVSVFINRPKVRGACTQNGEKCHSALRNYVG